MARKARRKAHTNNTDITENASVDYSTMPDDELFNLLSKNQWRFITALIDNPHFSKKDAAEHIGLEPDTVYRWDKFVDEAHQRSIRNTHSSALHIRKQSLLKAIQVHLALLDSEDEAVRLKASQAIIDYELGKASQPTTIDGKIDVTATWRDLMAIDDNDTSDDDFA